MVVSAVCCFLQEGSEGEEEEEEFEPATAAKCLDGDDEESPTSKNSKKEKNVKMRKANKKPGDGSGVSNKIEVRGFSLFFFNTCHSLPSCFAEFAGNALSRFVFF